MRIAHLLVMPIAVAAAAAAAMTIVATLTGCERESSSDSGPPPPPVSTRPTTRRIGAATNPLLAVTQPTTTSASTLDASDPLATPDRAVAHMFDLMQKQDVGAVRAIMADPLPADALRAEVSKVADRLGGGAKWEVIDTHAEGVAAIVIFRTTFPDGKEDISPIMLINRYDRWKVMLGPVNLRKFTAGEKESINKVGRWALERLEQLHGVSTKPATTPATTPPAAP